MSAWTAVIHNSFCMFLIVMQWICHCVQWQIDSVGVFVWALAPFFGFCCVFCCLLRCFRWRNASLAGGFAGRRFLFGCGSRFCCFNRFADSKDLLSLYSVFPAYSHVRTEPLARHRPHSRKKNSDVGPLEAWRPSRENKTEQKSGKAPPACELTSQNGSHATARSV